jgi:opacity protein-like surface antigen
MNKRLLAATALTSTAVLFGPGVAWAQSAWNGPYLGFAFGAAFINGTVTTDNYGDAAPRAQSPVASILLGQNWGAPGGFFGIEGDFNFITNSTATATTTGGAEVETTLEHLLTLRARAGFAAGPRMMLFATGGLAVGNATLDTAYPDFGKADAAGFGQAILPGGVFGGGFEIAAGAGGNVKFRSEVLYYLLAPLTVEATGDPCCEYTAVSNPRGFLVRLGVTVGFN